ncbi:hypothetical protein BH23PSE1_BH23PSE1_04380 [soil metagenome]
MSRGVPEREAPLDPRGTAVLVIDVQKGIYNAAAASAHPHFHLTATETVIPNIARLLAAAGAARSEVAFTVIQSLNHDGRDRSLDYKATGFHFAPGSREAEVCDEVAPGPTTWCCRRRPRAS